MVKREASTNVELKTYFVRFSSLLGIMSESVTYCTQNKRQPAAVMSQALDRSIMTPGA